jgi:hypothetical protein
MEQITSFPHEFKIHGETINLEKNTLRRIDANGIESRLTLVGDVFGAVVNEGIDEWVVVAKYGDGDYCISKKHGMFGPFEKVEDIAFDEAQGISLAKGVLDGKEGDHPLSK